MNFANMTLAVIYFTTGVSFLWQIAYLQVPCNSIFAASISHRLWYSDSLQI